MADVKREKRTLILQAAYHIFLERGYAQTKISDIAKKASIGKGTVYEYFDSKEAIFTALFEYFADEYKASFTELCLTQKNKTCKELLETFLQFEADTLDFLGNELKLPPSSFIELELFKAPGLFPLFQRFMHYKFTLVYDCIKEGIEKGEFTAQDPAMATVAFMGAFTFYNALRNHQLPESMYEFVSGDTWSLNGISSLLFNGLVASDHRD